MYFVYLCLLDQFYLLNLVGLYHKIGLILFMHILKVNHLFVKYMRCKKTVNFLYVIVNYAANEDYAKKIGDGFLRQIKGAAPGEIGPGKEVGKGVFEYLVGVFYPNEKRIVIGAKAPGAIRIYW